MESKAHRPGNETLIKIVASCCFLGYLPLASGTFGALAGLGVYWLVRANIVVYAVATSFFLVLGFWVCGRAEKIYGEKDSGKIVIDEEAGMLLSLFLLPVGSNGILTLGPGDIKLIAVGFLMFRLVDVVKPFPLRKLERLNGSAGVMLDDVAAAVYTNVILRLLIAGGWK